MKDSSENIVALVKQLREACVNPGIKASDLLRQVRVIACILDLPEMDEWAIQELEGYGPGDPEMLPKYRRIPMVAKGQFMGPLGHELRNAPIYTHNLPPEVMKTAEKALSIFAVRDSVCHYDDLSAMDSDTLHVELSSLAIVLGKRIYNGMECVQVNGIVSKSALMGICDGVKNRVLSLTLELAKSFPVADTDYLRVNAKPSANAISTIINGGTNNLAVASNNFSQSISKGVEKGNLPSLRSALELANLPAESVDEIVNAVQAEEPTGHGFGKRVSMAIGAAVGHVAAVAGDISLGAVSQLLADAISSYYGIS